MKLTQAWIPIFIGMTDRNDLTQTGGTPYGPSHLASINSNLPLSEEEKRLCKALGKRVAEVALKLPV